MKYKTTSVVLLVLAALFLAPGWRAAFAADSLEQGFLNPPDSAKPWVYWFVMDGNFSREGITADLEAMKRVGIGGVLFMEVAAFADAGIPRGPVNFMSPPWRELFKHANKEAARLGLVITLAAGPGWCGSGGPWVRPEQSMQNLVSSETNLRGPLRFDGALPQPPTVAGFYRDVATLAFPTPDNPYHIEDTPEKTLFQRGNAGSISCNGVKNFISMPTKYAVLTPEQVIRPDRMVDLTNRLDAKGRLVWDVPQGKWTVLRFGHTSTGADTKPAPAAGEGLECDKLDKAALEAHFQAYVGKLMADIGPLTGKSLVALHIDSWEMGPQNWTAKFPEEFQKRRGYDPRRYLPAMTGRVVDSLEVSERFLWDLRQTVSELLAENYAKHLAELAHGHGMKLSIEPYDGVPVDNMTYGSHADVPMGEFWWRDAHVAVATSCAVATSIAHVYGKRVVQAEAFTSCAQERWLGHPAVLKPLGDWAYCEGINRFVFHRYAHQPWLDRWPGMTMGVFGVHYERTQTWWEQSKAWHQYLSRCQFLLQQGLFVADVCYLTPEASPQVFDLDGRLAFSRKFMAGDPPTRHGYNFDGCTPEAVITRMSAKDGRLILPDGMSYRLLVLPQIQIMTPPLLRKIKELVEGGATVVGARPLKSPSLSDYPKGDEEVKRLADELWGEGQPSVELVERSCGKGRVVSGRCFEVEDETASAQAARNPLGHAQWIWRQEGNRAISAPVGKCYFRRIFGVEAGRSIQSAEIVMTAASAFELCVNGQRAGTGLGLQQPHVMNVAPLLKPGANILTVAADHGADPAGLIGALLIRFGDGSVLLLNTDGNWETAKTVTDGWTTAAASADGWSRAMELGPLGMAPWGSVGEPSPLPKVFPNYQVISGLFAKMGVPPDFEADRDLRYTHRCEGNADIYFVANGQPTAVEATCTFRVSRKAPEIWDPVTGEMCPASAFKQTGGRTVLPLKFGPSGSLFVVFRTPTDVAQASGRNFPEFRPVQEIRGPWTVKFDPKWGGPEAVVFDSLVDWTKRPEEGIKYYSGTAIYTKTFNVPPAAPDRRQRLYLDLGDVKVMAQVKLNGKDFGVLWNPPFRVDITEAAKNGENVLEVSVVNLWPNRMIGDHFLPRDKRYTWTTWDPFQKDSPLLESGLLGPVMVRASERADVK